MEVTLTTHKNCPKCGKEVTVEVDGFFSSLLMASVIKKIDEEGGTITGSCGHRFYVEPKPKKPTFIKRLKNALRG